MAAPSKLQRPLEQSAAALAALHAGSLATADQVAAEREKRAAVKAAQPAASSEAKP